jgi:hypothetical protein
MKTRHNKKRNTAFLYETLVREIAKSVINKQPKRNDFIVSLIKEHFTKNTELARELELYKALNETNELDSTTADKLIQESKRAHQRIDKKRLFIEQSRLISKINRNLSKNVFNNFVPNYRNLATIAQIFNDDISVKNKVLLEKELIKKLVSHKDSNPNAKVPNTNLVYKTFIKKFNETYSGNLLEEQKSLLKNYITSFNDNGVQLKIFLNEELGRLKTTIKKSMRLEEVSSDPDMSEKTNKILEVLESFKNKPLDKDMLTQILKIQNLTKEIES